MRNLNKQHGRITLDAYVLRTFAANGFGDAAIAAGEPRELLDSFELYHTARRHRAYQLREVIGALLQAVADAVRPVIQNWQRQQQARATYRTLQALDSRTLRDLGFHRSELLSVATELATGASSTGVRTRLKYGI